jgi:SHS2 domain-containing protein
MADEYIAAYGKTLQEVFENAALAMFETMTDTKKVRQMFIDEFKVEAEDELSLLFSWLEALLLKFEVDRKLYSKFKVKEIKACSKGYALEAEAWGEIFDPERHPSRTDIKAVTWHRMEIVKGKDRFIARFILDI